MQFYAINGSPRRKNNTAILLQEGLTGIQEALNHKAQVELINLYDLTYRGCISCFHCKRLGGKSYGKCIIKDDLTEVLEKIASSDGLILGSPIYFGDITGMMRSFIERLLFPYLVYDAALSSLAPKKIPTAFIYTMNVPEQQMHALGYPERLQLLEQHIGHIFTSPEVMYACNTYQFNDYAKYKNEYFSEKEKAVYKKTYFPNDCNKAYHIGEKMAAKSK